MLDCSAHKLCVVESCAVTFVELAVGLLVPAACLTCAMRYIQRIRQVASSSFVSQHHRLLPEQQCASRHAPASSGLSTTRTALSCACSHVVGVSAISVAHLPNQITVKL